MPTPLLEPGSARSDGESKPTCREACDKTLNEPTYSPLAGFISNVILLAIVISTLSFIIGTVPGIEGSAWLDQLEVVVVGIFSVEYVSRITVHYGSRIGFILAPMNMVDLLAILPWYIEQLAGQGGGEVLRVLRVLRVVRVFRVFKLAKYAESMQVFATCLVNSTEALKLLCFFFSIAVLIFASLLYYAEKGSYTEVPGSGGTEFIYERSDGSESPFGSIPQTFWWAIVTMTTVGYGDTYPVEDAGKVIATAAMLGGVLVLALPLSVIGSNFTDAYMETLKEKAYKDLQEQKQLASGVDVFVSAAKDIDGHVAQLEHLLGAVSHAFATKGTDPAAQAVRAQFEVQKAAVKQALQGMNSILADPNVLQVVLADEGAPKQLEAARARLAAGGPTRHV